VVAEHDAVSFAAIDGSMLTGRGSTWKKLSAGASRVVDLERGDTVESAQLGAPSVGLSKPLQIAFPGDGSHTQVKLTPVRGAERYQVALFRSVGNGRERVEQLESRGPTATLSSQTPGKYSVVARALDRFGVPGHASAPESLRVIGVGLPEGARAESSTVLLPPNRRLSLVGVDGLLMTYGAGNHFVAAPSSVAMSRGAATRVRFRDPTSTREVSLNLIPHWVKANVSVGPKTARWPEDRVVFTVQLSDALGRPANVEDGVDVRVTVNLEPVHVDWKHEGSRLRGHVDAPRNSKGPWVVRVEVLREGAGVIGRDFLEVIESRAKPEPDAGTRRAEVRK
jgi:hypothetical protein